MVVLYVYIIVTLLMTFFVIIDVKRYNKRNKHTVIINEISLIDNKRLRYDVSLKSEPRVHLNLFDRRDSSKTKHTISTEIDIYIISGNNQRKVLTKKQLNLWMLTRFLIVDLGVMIMCILTYLSLF